MIGVLSKPDEAAEVQEFFQLFKTPWEFYEDSHSYDVVVVTADVVPEINSSLILIYGTGAKEGYAQAQVRLRNQFNKAVLNWGDRGIPIYGEVQAFEGGEAPVLTIAGQQTIVGLRFAAPNGSVVRLGYNLFREIRYLLAQGQPVEHAQVPTLDLHIDLLRKCILNEGLSLVEIPPTPSGRNFVVCLTHDIDFIGIRDHLFDHTMFGFLYRSTVGAFRELVRGRISVKRLAKIWGAAASLPFVFLGLKKDYWLPFEWYMKVEKGLSPTYYFIPFKDRQGEKVAAPHSDRRATAYDVTDLGGWTKELLEEGCEIGVHGIDAWHSSEKGKEELGRVANVTGQAATGIRMHWLLRDEGTYAALEKAGYTYDSTSGYNEAIGYRNGTGQAFRPLTAETLLELPLHIQDGALFFPQKLDLSDAEAWKLCQGVIENAHGLGGIVTVLWHDRSHGPERFWGEFYAKLVDDLKTKNVWFASGMQAVNWFNRRRDVVFERVGGSVCARHALPSAPGLPPMVIRVHPARPGVTEGTDGDGKSTAPVDHPWNGETHVELKDLASDPVVESRRALPQRG